MDRIHGFLAMGGYGAFVWPAFGVAALVLAGLWVLSWRQLRAREAELDLMAQRGIRRRPGTPGASAPPAAAQSAAQPSARPSP